MDDELRALIARRGLDGVAPEDVLHHPIVLNGAAVGIAEGINAYDNGIHRVDAHIGALVEALRADETLDDTLAVVTADHGEGLGNHGYWSYGLHLYEQQLRIPLVVRMPRRAGATPARATHAVSLLDVAPTIAAVTGLRPADGHGREELYDSSTTRRSATTSPRRTRRTSPSCATSSSAASRWWAPACRSPRQRSSRQCGAGCGRWGEVAPVEFVR